MYPYGKTRHPYGKKRGITRRGTGYSIGQLKVIVYSSQVDIFKVWSNQIL